MIISLVRSYEYQSHMLSKLYTVKREMALETCSLQI